MNSKVTSAGVHNVPALEKAMRILEALAAGNGGGGSAAISQRLGISQSTCYRTLQTFEAADWIRKTGDDGYALSLGLLPIARALQGVDHVVALLRAPMERLVEATRLSVKLSVRQGHDQVTLARVESPSPLGVTSPVGARFPVVVGASGSSLLSVLPAADLDAIVAHADRARLWGHDDGAALRRRIAACLRDGVCDYLGIHPQGIDTVSAPLSASSGHFALTLVGLRGDFAGARGAQARQALLKVVRAAKILLDGAT